MLETPVVLVFELVGRRGEVGIAFPPEGVNQPVTLLFRPERQEDLALPVGDDEDDVPLEPRPMLLGKPLDAVVRRHCKGQ